MNIPVARQALNEELDIVSLARSRDEEIRAMRALGILLESRLIDHLEYERRIASYQKK